MTTGARTSDQPDPLTHLLNEMARRRLDPTELGMLRAAVRETARPVLAQLLGGPVAAAAAEQEIWDSLFDHFPDDGRTTEPITDGAAYIRQIADAVRVEHTAPATTAVQAPALPVPPVGAPPVAPPVAARRPVLRWALVAVTVLLLLLTAGGLATAGLLWFTGTARWAGTLPAPSDSAAPTEPIPSVDPSTAPAPQATEPVTQPSPPPPTTTSTGDGRGQPPAPGRTPTQNTAPPPPAVVFTGTTTNPTITVNGAGFGPQPAGTPWNDTPCGSYTDNGRDYGTQLSFLDPGAFAAGNGSCVGIKVVSWSPTRVVFRFGNSYHSFDHWYVTAGDPYEITVNGHKFTGTVGFS
jgi:hypothetical protein